MSQFNGRVLHIGGAMVDLNYWIEELPEQGWEALAEQAAVELGGAYNSMVAAARQGVHVRYGGGHGHGYFGDLARATMADAGIEVVVPEPAGVTGSCVVLITAGGDRTFIPYPAGEIPTTQEHLQQVRPVVGEWVIVCGYSLREASGRQWVLDWLKSVPADTRTLFDPSPLVGDFPEACVDAVLARSHWLSCNWHEALAMTGSADPMVAIQQLHTRMPAGSGVVLRRGPDGCLVRTPDGSVRQLPALDVVDCVDTNGAGDAHVGVFVAGLAQGRDPLVSAQRANLAAGISVTRRGSAEAPTAQALDDLIATGTVQWRGEAQPVAGDEAAEH